MGLLGEVDFNGRYGLPLGITLGYFYGFPTDMVGSGVRGTVLGFWYTAKQDFVKLLLRAGAKKEPLQKFLESAH